MTRKEKIRKATLEFVSAMCQYCSVKEKCKDTKGYCTEYDSQECGFVAGVQWADENPSLESIWHEASEMPKEEEWILVQFDEDLYDTYLLRHFNADIFCAWCNNVIRWAYVRDLLPKGGEK